MQDQTRDLRSPARHSLTALRDTAGHPKLFLGVMVKGKRLVTTANEGGI